MVFFLLSFSDLSHHRTCRSAYGGSLIAMQFGIDADKGGVTLDCKSFIRNGSMQNPAVGYAPISLASICPLPCPPSADTTLHEVLESCTDTFPTFPDIAPYAPVIPSLGFFKECFHICQIVISYPTTDIFRQAFLQPR